MIISNMSMTPQQNSQIDKQNQSGFSLPTGVKAFEGAEESAMQEACRNELQELRDMISSFNERYPDRASLQQALMSPFMAPLIRELLDDMENKILSLQLHCRQHLTDAENQELERIAVGVRDMRNRVHFVLQPDVQNNPSLLERAAEGVGAAFDAGFQTLLAGAGAILSGIMRRLQQAF